ncbi:MAG: hypothetical protein PHU04_00595 [Candidatus Peribacteraceae bacterium]|nr:hypothetical protein [Candidatus Peribacteraceae bacterium]
MILLKNSKATSHNHSVGNIPKCQEYIKVNLHKFPPEDEQKLFDAFYAQAPKPTQAFYDSCIGTPYEAHYHKLLVRYFSCNSSLTDVLRIVAFNIHCASFEWHQHISKSYIRDFEIHPTTRITRFTIAPFEISIEVTTALPNAAAVDRNKLYCLALCFGWQVVQSETLEPTKTCPEKALADYYAKCTLRPMLDDLSNLHYPSGRDVNVLALVKGKERYVFLYTDENRAECLRVLGRYATNEDLSFTWYDAAVLSQKIRQEKGRESEQLYGRFRIP